MRCAQHLCPKVAGSQSKLVAGMVKACLRHALLTAVYRIATAEDCWSLCAVRLVKLLDLCQETIESLGISPGSRLASVFDSADVDKDSLLSDTELATFEQKRCSKVVKGFSGAVSNHHAGTVAGLLGILGMDRACRFLSNHLQAPTAY